MYDKELPCPYCTAKVNGRGRNKGLAIADAQKKLKRHLDICKQNPDSRAFKKRHK